MAQETGICCFFCRDILQQKVCSLRFEVSPSPKGISSDTVDYHHRVRLDSDCDKPSTHCYGIYKPLTRRLHIYAILYKKTPRSATHCFIKFFFSCQIQIFKASTSTAFFLSEKLNFETCSPKCHSFIRALIYCKIVYVLL